MRRDQTARSDVISSVERRLRCFPAGPKSALRCAGECRAAGRRSRYRLHARFQASLDLSFLCFAAGTLAFLLERGDCLVKFLTVALRGLHLFLNGFLLLFAPLHGGNGSLLAEYAVQSACGKCLLNGPNLSLNGARMELIGVDPPGYEK